jgi:lysophospholipase L1-like esterase
VDAVTHRIISGIARALAAAAACLSLAAQADTLFVAGAVPVSAGDADVIDELESLGETVTVVQDSSSSSASANGKNLVVISDSVAPGRVGNKFTQVGVAVIAFDHGVFDNLGMTGTDSGTDFGRSAATQTQIRMSGNHALTAGLSGLVTVGTGPARFSWGRPGSAAVVAATLKSNSAKATLFGYERGAQLASGASAPARRVGFYPNEGATNVWNATGRMLFRNAVLWALEDVPPPPGETVRIYPLGDSITKGRIGHWSYRRDLEAALVDAGCSFDFVGSASGPSSGPGAPLVDRDHEGHSGLRTDQIRKRMHNWLPGNDHEWVLLHAGTNDVLQGTSITLARNELGRIIDKLRERNPNVGILIAQIIPNLPENEFAVSQLNDEIAGLAADKHTAGSPVILVDQYSGYSSAAHNYDGIHPNDAGEARMADRWFDALRPRIAAYCTQ